MKLQRDFYERDTLKVARDLLGKFLVHRAGDKIYRAMIVETEAYDGLSDKASHASRGRTERNHLMFGPAGYAYVYLIYGVYHCLNFTTQKEGYPAAVLIRALDYEKADGPGKLCREFQIAKNTHNGLDLTGDVLYAEDEGFRSSKISVGPRIGVSYAGECARWMRRFWIEKD